MAGIITYQSILKLNVNKLNLPPSKDRVGQTGLKRKA
jgi:hypothetical protein